MPGVVRFPRKKIASEFVPPEPVPHKQTPICSWIQCVSMGHEALELLRATEAHTMHWAVGRIFEICTFCTVVPRPFDGPRIRSRSMFGISTAFASLAAWVNHGEPGELAHGFPFSQIDLQVYGAAR